MTEARRWGFSIPLFGITLAEHQAVMAEAEQLGYTDAWSLEVDGTDAFTPLALVPVYLAALRAGMLRLAGREADGVIINWLAAHDVPKVVQVARDAAGSADRDPAQLEVACRIFVVMHDDLAVARDAARRLI